MITVLCSLGTYYYKFNTEIVCCWNTLSRIKENVPVDHQNLFCENEFHGAISYSMRSPFQAKH